MTNWFGSSGRLSIFAAAALLANVLISAPSSACDDIGHWMAAYQDEQADDRLRLEALEQLVQICDGYEAVKSDRTLLAIVTDGLRRGYEGRRIQALFDNYRCLSGARREQAYAVVVEQLDVSECPSEADLAAWHLIKADRANLRQEPSASAPLIGDLSRGTVVEWRDDADDWMKVQTWKGLTGYIHSSLLEPFLLYRGE